MSMDTANSSLHYLSVAEAAGALGVSRLRVREAAALGAFPSLRDNNGHLRVDLSGLPSGFALPDRAQGMTPSALLDIMFDEVEDLKAANDEAARDIGMLKDLAARQASALERAEALLDSEAESKARLIGLLDRAMQQLAARDGAEATGRTDGTAAGTAAMAGTAARAIEMLDRAMTRAEGGQEAAARTGAMLDRALAAGERMQSEIAERDGIIADRTATAERALELSERAMALAGQGEASPKKGFWRRLFRL